MWLFQLRDKELMMFGVSQNNICQGSNSPLGKNDEKDFKVWEQHDDYKIFCFLWGSHEFRDPKS